MLYSIVVFPAAVLSIVILLWKAKEREIEQLDKQHTWLELMWRTK